MICKECGNKIDDNSTFCKFCGYKVSAESSCQKAYLNTPTENSSAIKSKQVKKNIIISLSSIITVLTAIVLITVIIKIHNKQENIVTDDDLSKTEIGSGVTDNAIKSKSAKSITDSNTNVEIESEKTDSNNKTYESIEFIGIDNYDDWSAANFYDTDGNEVEYIDNKYFSDFEETGCSITVTLKYLNTDYYVFAPKDAVDWNALYKLDGNYITGVPTAADAVSINNESYTFPNEISNDIIENTRTFIQSDGFFCLFDFKPETVSFNLSAKAISYLKNNATINDDNTEYGGIVFQMYECIITDLVIDVPLSVNDVGMIIKSNQ